MTAHFPPTLVLNADYQPLSYYPLSTIPWQEAMKAVVEGTHIPVAYYDLEVRSSKSAFQLPSVLAIKNYVNVEKHLAFTRFNVFLRDDFTCQYCLKRFHSNDLTFDHVVPRSKGGQTTWTNIVAACQICNSIKAARQDMQPAQKPFAPHPHQLMNTGKRYPPNHLHETWTDFLYWDVPLEA